MSVQATLATTFRNAVELEQKCDTEQTASLLRALSPKRLAAIGLAAINLIVASVKSGWAGGSLLELVPDPATNGSGELPSSSLRVGDVVKLDLMAATLDEEADTAVEGVVTKVTNKNIVILVKDGDSCSDECLNDIYNNTGKDNLRVWVVKVAHTATYKRIYQALRKLEHLSDSHKTKMMQILLGESSYTPCGLSTGKDTLSGSSTAKYTPSDSTRSKEIKYFNEKLNQSQKDAIKFSISSPVTIIHGPPGTGKTYTLIELIKQLKFNQKEKVLVCGASNTAVDNILERLSPVFNALSNEGARKMSKRKVVATKNRNPEKLIRIGHPARVSAANLRHCLFVLSKSSYDGEGGENLQVLQDIDKDIKNTLSSIKTCKRYGERKVLYLELKQLRRELREREKKISHDLINNAEVVLSTLHGAGSKELYEMYKDQSFGMENPLFDTIIIDEVSQSLEPQCWIPLVTHIGCKRLVIAGDNKQLSATVESKEAAEGLRKKKEPIADLEVTLFDRLMENHNGHEFRKLLNVQYRMNKQIMEFPSKILYDGELRAAENVKDNLLCDLPNVEKTDETTLPCIWYDTQGGDYPEQTIENDVAISVQQSAGSKFNELEAVIVLQHIEKLVSAGVQPAQIGVISPYSAQVAVLRKLLGSKFDTLIEVSTVDGFQGRENEVIIVSLVRSNDNREVGFLNDPRRLNVAMTRPKRQLCVVGDIELLQQCGVSFLAAWAKYAEDNYQVEYPEISNY